MDTNDKLPKELEQVKELMAENHKKNIHKIALFLDFDGVINIYYEPGSKKFLEIQQQTMDTFNFADETSVKRLSDFCVEHDVDVIVSSSWRYRGIEYDRAYLKRAGVDPRVRVVDVTKIDWDKSRAEVICDYMIEHPIYSGMIVFDDGVMKALDDYQVVTSMMEGITEEAIVRAEKIVENF